MISPVWMIPAGSEPGQIEQSGLANAVALIDYNDGDFQTQRVPPKNGVDSY